MAYSAARKNNFNGNKLSKEEYQTKKKAKMEKQSKNLEMTSLVAEYLDGILKSNSETKIAMSTVLDFLLEKGFSKEDTKDIAQTNYIMVELANAQKNTRISGTRVNIRVLYLEERLKTSYMVELHEQIGEIIKKYDSLFFWDQDSDAEGYTIITDQTVSQ